MTAAPAQRPSDNLSIAVIGSGAAGLTAAYLLQQKHRVTLFEKQDRIGGHVHTVLIDRGPDAGTPVDTGFIVLNNRNYPVLHRLLDRLGCAWRWSNMSFGFYGEDSGLAYAGTGLSGLFAQRANLFRPSYYAFLREVLRFCRVARADLLADRLGAATLGEFLAGHKITSDAIRQYIVPMAAAIWSAPQNDILGFPAATLFRFWENHGLLALDDRPRWQTVVGGSHAYVKAILAGFRGRVITGARIAQVRRTETHARLLMEDGSDQVFDCVILAAHADESLALLADPTAEETRLLGPWRYQHNLTVLHTDITVMPPLRRAWASWNYVQPADLKPDQPVPVTYWMNLLQGLRTRHEYLVTLNPTRPIAAEHLVREISYTHPVFSAAAAATQRDLPLLNEGRVTCFCGSYFGYGFHEDAVRSGAAVAKCFGVEL